MLERSFDWKRLRLLHAIGLLLGAMVGITLGLLGAGTYSLLIPSLLTTLPFIFDLFVVNKWRPSWQWSWGAYAPAFRFGFTRMGSGICETLRNVSLTAAITSFWGFAALGIFNRAIGLAQMLCTKFASQLMTSIYPVLTRLESANRDPATIGALILRVVLWSAMPIAAVFAFQADALVDLIYGPRWESVVVLLPVGGIWGTLSALNITFYRLLLARNKQSQCFKMDLFALVGSIALIVWVLPHGPLLLLKGLAVILAIQSIISLRLLITAKGLRFRGFIDAVIPASCGLLIGISVAHGAIYLLGSGVSAWIKTDLWILLFVICYLAAIRIFFSKLTRQLCDVVPLGSYIRRGLLFSSNHHSN